ncbi:viral A-type inclusion protein [Clostridium botulinum]|nr:viral A-type inclusion protein [Clostridium botulinum]
MNIHELQTERLDINNKYNVELVCKQLDDVILKIIVYDKNLPADLSNYNVRLKAFKVDQVPIIQNTNIIIKDNVVTIKADKQLTTTQGIVKAELQFINKTTLEKKSTFYLEIEVVASVLAVDGTVSIPTCTLLEELDNKLDEIENIGNVLEEAKVVRDDLEEKTITGTTLKNDLNTNIETGTQLKTDLIELIPQVNKSKSDLDTSKINADLSNTTLLETTNNAETKKQEVISECKVADEKIKQMNEFGNVTEVVKDVTSLKTEVNTARDNEIDLNTRLERDKTNILKTIGQVDITKDGDIASQLKDCVKNIKDIDGSNAYISDANNCGIVGKRTTHRTNSNTLNTPYKQGLTSGYVEGIVDTYLNSANFGIQIGYATGHELLKRSLISGTWSEWKQLATVDDTGWIDISSTINSKITGIARIRRIWNQVFFEIKYKGVVLENEIVATMPTEYAPKGQSEYVFCRFPTGIITLDIQPNGRVMMDYQNIGTQQETFWCCARTNYLID